MDIEKYGKLLEKARDPGLLLLRAGVGLSFFYIHGLPKITAGPAHWAQLGAAMGNMGVHFSPVFWGLMAALAEFAGGAFLALGLLTRPAAAVMAFNMLVAVVMHLAMGQGLEPASHALEDMFVFAALLLTGPGRYSLDALIFRPRPRA
jgi:putative oxidoreductase